MAETVFPWLLLVMFLLGLMTMHALRLWAVRMRRHDAKVQFHDVTDFVMSALDEVRAQEKRVAEERVREDRSADTDES